VIKPGPKGSDSDKLPTAIVPVVGKPVVDATVMVVSAFARLAVRVVL